MRKYFEKYGGVQDAIVIRNVATNVSRGFGFVTFDSEEIADKCVKENNYKIKGKKVDIKRADPRQTRQRQSRIYPLGSGGSPDESSSMYYPPAGWPEMPPPNFPDAKAFNEARASSIYSWPYMPPMNAQGYEESSKRSEENSRKKEKQKSEVGPIKGYKKKNKTYAPY